MDPARIGNLLADRFRRIVPDGFYVEFDGTMLWYTSEEGRFPGQLSDYRVGSSGDYIVEWLRNLATEAPENATAEIGRMALDHLQDYVSEATHDPWPGTRRMPVAKAAIRNSELCLWFEDNGEVLLGCEPIPLIEPA